jgi:NAD(P)-dependent dehydrogenase (short-subunit alcohol dehydrogenase family)
VIDIDLNGTFYGCHAAYPHLKASKHGGSIISIITMLGVTGWPGAVHAAAAKGGILSLSRTLAVEWGGDGIRVNTISPGPIGDTEGVRACTSSPARATSKRRRRRWAASAPRRHRQCRGLPRFRPGRLRDGREPHRGRRPLAQVRGVLSAISPAS